MAMFPLFKIPIPYSNEKKKRIPHSIPSCLYGEKIEAAG
jgi:hypothetical protein